MSTMVPSDGFPHPNMHLIPHKHLFLDGRLGVIPSKRAFSERFESSREVVVHVATVVVHIVVEVVVHVPWMFGVHGVFEGRR